MDIEELKAKLKNLKEGELTLDVFQLKDINTFLEALKEGLVDSISPLDDAIDSSSILSLIPDDIPLPIADELIFSNITYKKANENNPKQIYFTIGWPGEWNLLEDYFQIGELEIDIAIIGSRIESRIVGVLIFNGFEMEATVQLPEVYLELNLLNQSPDAEHPSPLELLRGKDYTLPNPGINQEDNAEIKLSQLSISSYPLSKEFVIDFGMNNILITENLHLNFETHLAYLNGDITLEFLSQIEFEGINNIPSFNIPIQARYNSINNLIRFEGGIALPQYNVLDIIKMIGNRMNKQIDFPSFHHGKDDMLQIRYLALALEKSESKYSFEFDLELINLIHIRHNQTLIFSLKELLLQFSLTRIKDGSISVGAKINSLINIAGQELNVIANKQNDGWEFIGKTKAGETLALLEWLSDILEAGTDFKLPKGLTDFKLKNAEVTYHTGTKKFSVKGESDGDLEVPVINNKIHSLKFSFSRDEFQETELYFEGATTINYQQSKSVDIIVKISYQKGSWHFEGRTGLQEEIELGKVIGSVFSKTTVELPSAITGFKAKEIGLKYQSKEDVFHLSATVETENFPAKGVNSSLLLGFNYTGGSQSDLEVSGKMTIEDPKTSEEHQFLIAFGKSGKAKSSKTFLASYQGAATFQKIVGLFSSGLAGSLPKWVTPEMNDATFLISKNSKGESKVLFLLKGDIGFSLSKLDLVGKYLPPEEVHVDITMNISTGVLEKEEMPEIKALLAQTDSDVLIPEDGFGKGFSLKTIITGSSIIPENTGFTFEKTSKNDVESTSGEEPKSKTQWIDTSKKFGPVFIKKVGVTLEEGKFKLLIDGGLSMGAFTFRLMDLGVRVPLSRPFDPSRIDFSLAGLELKYKTAKVSLSGAFLAEKILYDGKLVNGYFGEAALVLNDKSFKAIGSFINIPDHPSFFLYVVATIPIGGPSYFYINGFALGFGINSRLNIPEIDGVRDFVLVKTAFNETQFSDQVPESNLKLIQTDITPEIGSYWVAIGLKVMHVKILQSFFLATVEFGNRLEITLLGLTKLVLPPPGNSIVKAELAIKAQYLPDAGTLTIEGRLTKNSYILSPDAHLTGGFAFFAWFKDQYNSNNEIEVYAGDFVLSMGGYHPKFKKPKHYPNVPRLGLSWQVSKNILIKGGEYYALTPSSFMAGGRLEASAEVGPVKAWFTAEAHLLINFSPFQYSANVTVRMGATFEIDLGLGTVRKTMSFSASLDLWGPPFAGRAVVDLGIIDFVIEFGPSRKIPLPISWKKFQKQFLPPIDKTLMIQVSDGFVKDISQDEHAQGLDWILNPSEMILSIESNIPAKSIILNEEEKEIVSPENWHVGIAPMNLKAAQFESKVTIQIYKGENIITDRFEISKSSTRNVPKALWGKYMDKNKNGEKSLIKNTLAGVSLSPKPFKPDITVEFEVEQLLWGFPVEDFMEVVNGQIPENTYAESPGNVKIRTPDSKHINALINGLGLNIENPDEFSFNDKDDQWMESDIHCKTTGSLL